MTTVAALLDASHQAHAFYLKALPRMVTLPGQSLPDAQYGDAETATRWLREALRTRTAANDLDPAHTDPAWGDEAAQYPNRELLGFYAQALERGPDVVPDLVSDLLTRSHRAHALYVQNVPRMTATAGQMTPFASVGDAVEAHRWLEEAAQTRVAAQLLDPDHRDPAWRAEVPQYPHDELLQFYQQQLTA